MGAFKQSVYIFVISIVTTIIAGYILRALIAEPDPSDIWIALIMGLATALLPAYLVIKNRWGA